MLTDLRTAALFALAFFAVVLTDARPAALFAPALYAVVLTDARPAALFAPAFFAVVLTDARPAALFAPAFFAVVLTDLRAAALFAPAFSAVVLTDARAAALFAIAFDAFVLADLRAAALFALASSAVVRALCVPLLHSASSFSRPAASLPALCLPCRARSLGQRTISLPHHLPFPLALKPLLLVFGLFLPLDCVLPASRPTPLSRRLVDKLLVVSPLLLGGRTCSVFEHVTEEALVLVNFESARHFPPIGATIASHPDVLFETAAFLTNFLVYTAVPAHGVCYVGYVLKRSSARSSLVSLLLLLHHLVCLTDIILSSLLWCGWEGKKRKS